MTTVLSLDQILAAHFAFVFLVVFLGEKREEKLRAINSRNGFFFLKAELLLIFPPV